MDFAKQEIIENVRALLIQAQPYEENKIIGKLYTRELGLISALWSCRNEHERLIIAPIGITCQIRAYNGLYRASNLEPAYSFAPQNQSNNFGLVWWITKLLIEASQGEIATPSLWDLTIKTLTHENKYQDFRVPIAFMMVAFCETGGLSIEEYYALVNDTVRTELLALMEATPEQRQSMQLVSTLFETLLRFVGEKLESEELLKYCERGDLNPHEENLTTTSK